MGVCSISRLSGLQKGWMGAPCHMGWIHLICKPSKTRNPAEIGQTACWPSAGFLPDFCTLFQASWTAQELTKSVKKSGRNRADDVLAQGTIPLGGGGPLTRDPGGSPPPVGWDRGVLGFWLVCNKDFNGKSMVSGLVAGVGSSGRRRLWRRPAPAAGAGWIFNEIH